ncbi:MAG: hypothetical protein PHN39_03750 [Candidatus Pacebacteria bacterium]|jgi:hypothetical protein|nr:hypothetical protein [Candidatus Paceibacterota bacterium]
MKIYFAGADADIERLKVLGVKYILIAYPYFKRKGFNKKFLGDFNLFLDSGAYSVFTGVAQVDLKEMIEDYKKLDFISLKCGLDVIGNAEETKQNCLKMREAGLDVVPTFHYGESFEYLKFYCDNFNYVALGGVAQLRSQSSLLIRWLDNCYSIIRDYVPKIKVHGFAITSYKLLLRYPFYSVDSTTWQSAARFAEHNELKGFKLKRIKSKHLPRDSRLKKNVKSILDLEKFVTNVWKSRGIIWSN